MNDTSNIHPTRPESESPNVARPLFGEADGFAQQLRLAAQAHRSGRLDEAISSYLRLLTVRPYHAELHNNLGVALRLVGKLDASVAHHRLSLAIDPENPALHSNLGNSDAPIYALGDCMEVGDLNLPFILPIMAQARALAKTLTGTPTDLVYSAMPVAVKTPACPTIVCPPPQGSIGAWQEEVGAAGVRALFVGADGKLLGFALLGNATMERQTLAALMPAWL